MKPFALALLAALGFTVCACSANNSSVPAGPAPASPASSAPVTVSPPAAAPQPPATQAVSPAPAQPATAPGCITRYLNITATLSGAAGGSSYATLVFKNLDNAPCTLYGFPGVSQADGQPVQDVGQPSSEDPSTARELVTLQPGGYAHATLKIADAGNFPASECTPVSSEWLYVIPPNQYAALPVYFASTACSGSARLLTVTAVRPGTGS
jgi:Protein of unknown function (DUF4232)